jgi:hypothetical protein
MRNVTRRANEPGFSLDRLNVGLALPAVFRDNNVPSPATDEMTDE